MSGSIQDCTTRETQWFQNLRTRWSVLQTEEIEEILKLLCLLSFEPGMWTGYDVHDVFSKLADFFVVKSKMSLSENLIRDLPSSFVNQKIRVGWYMMLCLLELILYFSKDKKRHDMSSDLMNRLDIVFTSKCNLCLQDTSMTSSSHLFVPLMMAWGAFREDGRIEKWIFETPEVWNMMKHTLQYDSMSLYDDDELVFAEEDLQNNNTEISRSFSSAEEAAMLGDSSSDMSCTIMEESMTMMGMKMMELLDLLCRVFPVLRRLPQRFDGIFIALKSSQTYPFDHTGLNDISSRAMSSQNSGVFGMIAHSIRQFPCHISPAVRIATSFVLNADSAFGIIAMLGSLDRFTWWTSKLEEGTMIGDRLLVDARIKIRRGFGDDDEGVWQTLSKMRCHASRTDVLKSGDSNDFEKATVFRLDTPYVMRAK